MEQPLFAEVGRAKAATVLSVLAIATFHEEKAKGTDEFSPVNIDTVSQPRHDKLPSY